MATAFTISSGGSGGVFGPSMLIGGMIGGFYGQLTDWLFPAAHINPAAYVLVGMGGFFAGVSKTPLTSIVIVSEMTGSYSLLVPLMLACGLNMAISRHWTIYEEQVPSPIDSPAHQGDFVVDVLDRIQVSDVTIRKEGIEPIPASMPFKDLIQRVARSTQTLFPVVDGKGRLTGVFTLRDLRLALVGSEWGPLVLADDLATRPVLSVTPEDTLHTALRRMTELNIDEIPVVQPDDSTQLIGLLSRRELTSAYTALIQALRSPATSESGQSLIAQAHGREPQGLGASAGCDGFDRDAAVARLELDVDVSGRSRADQPGQSVAAGLAARGLQPREPIGDGPVRGFGLELKLGRGGQLQLDAAVARRQRVASLAERAREADIAIGSLRGHGRQGGVDLDGPVAGLEVEFSFPSADVDLPLDDQRGDLALDPLGRDCLHFGLSARAPSGPGP